jgi:23S rRNA pseudouridine2457 synthase
MSRLILFNKPYQVLSQFTDGEGRQTLADYINIPAIYAAGRLDRDSEGLLLLTDNGKLQQRLSNPRHKTWKTYLVEVEGIPQTEQIIRLRQGVVLKDGLTLPTRIRNIDVPTNLWLRHPPVRFRKSIPTNWLEIKIREGRNRQVRRMTAAVDLPTLRLIRTQIGVWELESLQPGEWREIRL